MTVEQLDLDGHDAPQCSASDYCRLPSPTVNGDNIVFQDNDVTNRHQGICFNLGNASYGRAVDVTIQRNRIHDCGLLPANNHEHGIYLSYSDNTRILGNTIYDNADRGVQLYPDAQRTLDSGADGAGRVLRRRGDLLLAQVALLLAPALGERLGQLAEHPDGDVRHLFRQIQQHRAAGISLLHKAVPRKIAERCHAVCRVSAR